MTTEEPKKNKKPRYIVGVGASAGGLESLERLFAGISGDLGACYVVIQHLSPNYETMMDQLLARHTHMNVCIAEQQQVAQANHVYVIPPKKDMVIEGNQLILKEQDETEMPHLPIDRFFESMADSCGRSCVAIVLSGTGSDGSRGVKAVRGKGGLVLCESEATAKFSGMPRSAQATGCVDYVVPPDSMGAMLTSHFMGRRDLSIEFQDRDENQLQVIFELMKQRCQIDFAHYKPSTVSRRIDRRMSLSGIKSLDEYIIVLRENEAELDKLYQDMLIGVTKFFRDKECFETLESEIIPTLLTRDDAKNGVRVWVAGCATGEEAYSLAILFDEIRSSMNLDVDVKIFATDVHPDSLHTAGVGRYSTDKLDDVSAERKRKYFVSHDDTVTVIKPIRQMVLFAPHNVLQDPPFTDLHMVSCRNLLIYFDGAAQRKALTLFHFALRRGGILFLGPSEAIGNLKAEFKSIDEKFRLYSKRRDARLPPDVRLPIPARPKVLPDRLYPKRENVRGDLDRKEIYDLLLDMAMPPTLLVNEQRQVVETFGGAELLLKLRGRHVSTDLLDLCPKEVTATLSAGLRRVERSRKPIRLPVARVSTSQGELKNVDIVITPMNTKESDTLYYAIQINTKQPDLNDVATKIEEPALLDMTDSQLEMTERVRVIEDELHHTKENLQATIEELESSNEELQATNEELIASNEELQSTNEELNSVNEELHTVNVEYQNKNAELQELNEDMRHLFSSTDIGTVFLDDALTIRRFTPTVAEIFDLEPQDVGRRLASFSHTLKIDNLREKLAQVLKTAETYEQEVTDEANNHYFMRILPYQIEGQVSGVILTLTEINSLVEARDLAKQYQRRLQKAIDAVPVFVSFVNTKLQYEYANRAYTEWLGLENEQIIGQHIRNVIGEKAFATSEPYLKKVTEGVPQNYISTIDTQHGTINIKVNYQPSFTKGGKVNGFYVAVSDVTSVKEAERELAKAVEQARKANQAKSEFLARMSHEIRSPMTSIMGFADILDEQLTDADNKNCVGVIRENGRHLLELINDLLDLAKIESGKLELSSQIFSASEILKECHNSVIAKAVEKNIDLNLDDQLPENRRIVGDRRRFRQIVTNLLGNAVKFTDTGSVTLKASLNENESQVHIAVVDTGTGISTNDFSRLFEPFTQIDGSSERKYEGSGLGLTITKQLVETMGGELSVESRHGVGSVFRVILDWVEVEDGDVSSDQRVELDPPIARLDKKRILVVDDRREIRFIAEHFLSDVGAIVTTVSNGNDAVEVVKLKTEEDSPYDCVITDIQMPEVDGYETTKRIRELGFQGPIIALTANAMESDREQCLAAGCDDFIAKPIDRQVLLNAVANATGSFPNQKENSEP